MTERQDTEPYCWTSFRRTEKEGGRDYAFWGEEIGEPAVAFFTTEAQAIAYQRNMGWDPVTYGVAILPRDDALIWLRGMRDEGIGWVFVNPTMERENPVPIDAWTDLVEHCSVQEIRMMVP